jgi:hypothetical protein
MNNINKYLTFMSNNVFMYITIMQRNLILLKLINLIKMSTMKCQISIIES